MRMHIEFGDGIEIDAMVRYEDLCDDNGTLSDDPGARANALVEALDAQMERTVETISECFGVTPIVVGPEVGAGGEYARAKKIMQARVDEIASANDEIATDFADAVRDTCSDLVDQAVRTWGIEHQGEIVAARHRATPCAPTPHTRQEPARGGADQTSDDMSSEERAFYDALDSRAWANAGNDHATRKALAVELSRTLRTRAVLDWERRESTRAAMRLQAKTLLIRHHYPAEDLSNAVGRIFAKAERLLATTQ